MKILVVSDLHGKSNNFLKAYDLEKPDLVICAGDYDHREDDGSGIKLHKNTIKMFNHYVDGNKGCGLRAKNEQEFIKFMEQDFKTFNIGHKFILLTHIWDKLETTYPTVYRERMKILYEHKPDMIICGHTHIAKITTWNGIPVVNPGSIEKPVNRERPSYAIIDTSTKKWDIVIHKL